MIKKNINDKNLIKELTKAVKELTKVLKESSFIDNDRKKLNTKSNEVKRVKIDHQMLCYLQW